MWDNWSVYFQIISFSNFQIPSVCVCLKFKYESGIDEESVFVIFDDIIDKGSGTEILYSGIKG